MQYRRTRIAGGCYFFTVVTANRQPVLLNPRIYNRLRQAVVTIKSRYPFSITAWCILPDHMHFIWRIPENEADCALRWRRIKHYVTTGIGIPRDLWQKRYWEHGITDDKDFENHMDYLHYNPVKHGYVENAGDWQFSSLPYYIAKGVYPQDWGYADDETVFYGEP